MGSQDDLVINGGIGTEEKEKEEEGEVKDAVLVKASVKHPLHNTWTMWYFKQEKGKDWSESQRRISSFSTIEDFWALFHHLQPVSQLPSNCDYSLFKDGIRPMWEDEVNKRGGRWLFNIHNHRMADSIWMNTLLCLIGEAFESYTDDICGAVFSIRNRGNKLGLWTRESRRKEANIEIGKILKSRLNLGNDFLEYQAHSESSSKSGPMQKPMYVV